jgi:tellurium resistance protein TerD
MSINLTKGQKINLSKECGSLSQITVGLGWDTNKYSGGYDFDLDASAFLCGANGKVRKDEDFIFYGNKDAENGSVHHTGDDRTGGSSEEGDDEQIIVDLTKLPADVDKVAFTATIYDAVKRNQNFGQVSNAYIRLVDDASGKELVRFDLGEDFSIETAIVAAEVYRSGGDWKFNAVGAGFSGGLAALCGNYGIDAIGE